MARAQNPNLLILERAAAQLGSLLEEVVFLGGCATGLLITDRAAAPIRATTDVDVITDVAAVGDYYRLAERLREQGFREDVSEGAPVCRWLCESVVLDVMPTDPAVLGFGSPWYSPALEASELVALPSGQGIRMVTAPYFLATKLAAFDGRGEGDYLLSHDMEDIVAVLDGRAELLEELPQVDRKLREHLAARFAALLADSAFRDALPGHLPGDAASQARLPILIGRIESLAGVT